MSSNSLGVLNFDVPKIATVSTIKAMPSSDRKAVLTLVNTLTYTSPIITLIVYFQEIILEQYTDNKEKIKYLFLRNDRGFHHANGLNLMYVLMSHLSRDFLMNHYLLE